MDLLIYGPAIFAGIIGSRYLSRLVNFCLMVVVFQFDLAILIGELKAAVFRPFTVSIIPALAGIVGAKYLGRLDKYNLQIGSRYFLIGNIANALLVIALFWLGGVLLAFQSRGKFIPLLFLQAIFVSAGSVSGDAASPSNQISYAKKSVGLIALSARDHYTSTTLRILLTRLAGRTSNLQDPNSRRRRKYKRRLPLHRQV